MNFLDAHLLTFMTFAPALGATLLVFLGPAFPAARARQVALGVSAVPLLLALRALMAFDPSNAELQLVERAPWIPTLHAEYFLAVDGLSILLVALTALVVPLSLTASLSDRSPADGGADDGRVRAILVLLLQTGMFGVFTALSFFHWFIFWEMVLVPAFFLVKRGGAERARAAALKFLLYTLVGSVAMLLAFQAIFWATGSLDFIELARLGQSGELGEKLRELAEDAHLGWSATTCATVALAGILFASAVKTPLWPFHTWLPDAYTEAPTPVTLLLTAGMSKMGVYAVLRLALPLFPDAAARLSPFLLVLAVVTVVASAFAALAQKDLKRMMAYSSVNHVGYCLVGMFAAATAVPGRVDDRAAALDGVVLQMFVHGITAGAMFFLLHAMEARTGKRGIDDFGGLRRKAPLFCGVFGVVTFASLGLPGLSGFVSELLILRGAFALSPWLAAGALVGVVVTAVFLLTVVQRVWWGPENERTPGFTDLSLRELLASGVFVLLIFAVGLMPGPFVSRANATVRSLAEVLAP